MMPVKPFNVIVDLKTGELSPGKRVVRHLSDVRYIFQDQKAAEAMLKEGDPLVYEVIYADIPGEPGHLAHCTTIIYPGKVGKEFFLTKGHLHGKLNTAEIYFCLQGEGRPPPSSWSRLKENVKFLRCSPGRLPIFLLSGRIAR
jgi:glucose-6-phosphate isomerase